MTYESEEMALGAFLGAYLGMVCLFIIVITVLSIIANWKVYTKAGREGWKCLIPVYNVYVLYDMGNKAVLDLLWTDDWFSSIFCSWKQSLCSTGQPCFKHCNPCMEHPPVTSLICMLRTWSCFYCRAASAEYSICYDPCFW